MKRNSQQRRRIIIELLQQQGELSVEQLAKQFDTSSVTIRKDLVELEKNGLLLRRYGGAMLVPSELIIDPACPKVSQRKLSIAKAAAALIKDHNRIIIDSGSTTAALLPELNSKQGLVVMTNSLQVVNTLQSLENEPTLLMTGGTWDPHSESFQGRVAEQVLRSYDFDQLFIGADGIDVKRGTTTFNELLSLSQVMADVSRDVIVMAESDKVGRKIPNLELSWQRIATVITDSDLSDELAQQIRQQGVNLVCADEVK